MPLEGMNPVVTNQAATTAATNPAETAATQVAAPETKPNDPMAPKFAALAKKEKQARIAIEKAKSKEAEIMRRMAEIEARERAWEDEFKADPIAAIQKRGRSYDDLTQYVLNGQKFTPEQQVGSVKQEIEALRKQIEEEKKQQVEEQKKAAEHEYEQTIQAYKEQLSEFLEQNKEKYELTKLYNADELVFQTIEEHFNRTQKVLTREEAADLVEKYLEGELDRTAKESKKFQSKFLQSAKKEDEPRIQANRGSTTLNNQMASSSAPSLLSPKTEQERLQRALAALG